ncbi:MAG: ABC transporter substrate-binding protein [Candidatus Spyradosoma sp.]
MKNSFIALFACTSLFFLLNALGLFEFRSFIDRNHRARFVRERVESVRAESGVVRLAFAYDAADIPTREAAEGIMLAADLVNAARAERGNALPRIELIVRDDASTRPALASAIQDFCDDASVAAVIGPFVSGEIPTARALTQFHGMPLVSPITVRSEKLPPLVPDNFVTFFPRLEQWSAAILDRMEASGHKSVLIISPEPGTYGDIFSTALEREIRLRGGQLFRLNYQVPFRRKKISQTIGNYIGGKFADTIFFGGIYNDFPELETLLAEREIDVPVYGSDALFVPQIFAAKKRNPLFLPEANIEATLPDFAEIFRERYGNAPSYQAVLGAETLFALADALAAPADYDPDALVETLRAASDELQKRVSIRILELPQEN